MRSNRYRPLSALGVVATLSVSLVVATTSTASAADGPSIQLPNVSPVAVNPVGQGSRGNEHDEAAQSARRGNQTGLPTSLPGEAGYSATSLSQSGKWDVAGQTGDFTWAYPLKVPPSAGGLEPSLGLGYSSSAVDGLTSASNNQASWVGDGWALWPGFVERTYGSCQTDLPGKPADNPADLCWKSDNATLSLNGSQTMLIRDDVSGVWKPKSDNGSRIDRWTGVGNGDDNGEHWRVTTTDGTQYFFGIRTDSGATWTVPVYGDDDKEPCHRPNDFAGSWCDQAYRWQLDKVVSTNGDVMIYNYGTETNKYGQNKNTRAASYVRGGWLKNIEYGLRDDTPGLAASGRVVFEEAERCVPGATNCDWNNPQHRANFPDVPLELKCDGTTCKDTWSPSFWTTKRLNKIRTEVRDSNGYRTVDSWTLRHEFPYPNDNGKPALWLAGVTHTGHDGGNLPLPEVTFEGVRKPNRVVKPNDGYSFLIRFRIGAIVSESGAVTSVSYADRNCDENTSVTPETNTLRCFPAKWTPPGVAEPRTDYFHKYVVDAVSSSDWIGSELSSTTRYEYVGGAAWHYDESEFTRDEDKTWNQFRGYGQVIVRTGMLSDDPKTRTKVSTTFYRGMNGDKGKPPAVVTDTEGGSAPDDNWLSGTVRESITYLGDTGEVVSKSVSEPYVRQKPTAKRGTFEARIVRPGISRSVTILAGGGKQETKTKSDYDEDDPTAMVKSTHDHGDVAKTDDDRCTTVKYARDAEKWLMSLPSEVDTTAVACGVAATFPKHAISNDRTTYDARGNVTSTQVLKARPAADQFEHITTSTIDPKDIDKHGRALKVADALGKVSTTEFTPALGGPVTQRKTTNPLGFATTMTLNPARGSTVKVVDVNERVTESEYDSLGRVTQVWLPGRDPSPERDNGNKKFAYKVSKTQPNVVTTDVLGPKGTYHRTKQILDGQLRPRQTQRPTDEGRLLTDIRYDSHGRAFQQSAPFFTHGELDDQLWKASNAETVPPHTVTEFDGAGRPTAEIFKAPTEKWRATTTYGGNWVKVTPPAGGVPTRTLFDARGQVTERRTDAPAASHDATTYSYTAAGQLSEVKDPENNVWKNEYDLLGRLVVQDDPDKGLTRKTYDNANRLVETKDALGTVLRTTYDDIGRPKLNEQVFPDNRPAQKRSEWTYDTVGGYGKGLPASVTRWIGTTAYTSSIMSYDQAARPTSTQLVIPGSETGAGGTYVTTVRYNPDGSVQSTGLPAIGVRNTPGWLGAETVLHEYDDFGRILKTTGGPAGSSPISYVADTKYTKYGELQQLWLGNPDNHAWVSTYYDSATRRPSRTIVDTQTAKPMQADVNYTYNPAGMVTSIVDEPLEQTPDVQCFSYDHLQRLTSAWTPPKTAESCKAAPSTGNLAGPAQYWHSFAYDKVGNRLTDTQHAAQGDTVRTYGKGDAHQLKSVSTAKPGLAAASVDEPTYDATGNTLSRKTPSGAVQKLEWDAEGRLAKVKEGDNATAEFVYGATGERLIRRDPGGTTVYLNGQELHVRGTVKTATRYYSHGGQVVAARSGDRLNYVATDRQGTVNTSVNVNTLKADRRRQLPFGGPRGPQGDFAGDKGFVGGTADSSASFVTLGARQYDPDTGRFLSVDQIGDFRDSQQMHGYSYANNSPVSMSDPSGLLVGLIDDGCPLETGCGGKNASSRPSTPSQNSTGSSLSKWPVVESQIPKGASPARQTAWIRRYQAQNQVDANCGLPGESMKLRQAGWCADARAELANANDAYDELLAKEKRAAEPSFWEGVGEVSKRTGEVVQCASYGLTAPGLAAACFRPSGTTFSQCLSGSVSAGVGASGDVCIAADDKGIGIVAKYDVSLNYTLGASVSGGGRYSNGDLDTLRDVSPETVEVAGGKFGDIELGVNDKKPHSLGFVFSRGKEVAIPLPGTLGLPQQDFAKDGVVISVADTGPLCRYCQAAADWIVGPFR